MKQLLVKGVCWLYEVLVFFKSAHLWNFLWFYEVDVNVQGNNVHIGFVLFRVFNYFVFLASILPDIL